MTSASVDRRGFIRISTSALGGILVSVSLPGVAAASRPRTSFELNGAINAFVRIDAENRVVIGARSCEIGQGVRTSLPMLIAEELDVPWSMVTVEQLDYGLLPSSESPGFVPKYGDQGAGGSTNIPDGWEELRMVGAYTRQRLIHAAAERWGAGTEVATLRTADGYVLHPDGRRLSYGEVATAAAQLQVTDAPPTLRSAASFKVIGQPTRVADAESIVRGQAAYGIDAKVPNCLVAVMERCPYFDGTLATFDASGAMAVRGVRQVVAIKGPAPGEPVDEQLADGVAVVADDTWSAMQGGRALRVTWNPGPWVKDSSQLLKASARSALSSPGRVARSDGSMESARAAAAKVVTAEYMVPFLAHATMEPPNCTVDIGADRALVIASCQSPGEVSRLTSKLTGISRLNIEIHLPRSGGGFGRRLRSDYVVEAVKLGMLLKRPVKLIWTREDDLQHDYYRPFGVHGMLAALDQQGRVTGWSHRVAATSRKFRDAGQQRAPDWVGVCDPDNYPAGLVPNYESTFAPVEFGLARGWWRAPLHTFGAFATESFVDEVAHAAGRDPLAYRLELLGEPRRMPYRDHGGPVFDTGRLATVLREASRAIGWGTTPVPAGRGRGIACHFTFGGYAAHAMEVSVADGRVQIHRCICAVDVGQPVNPLGIEAQMMGGTLDGISAALRLEITVEGGRVQQKNFTDYRLLRMSEAPDVEVRIVPSTAAPSGAGEMGVPSALPALANAVFGATGRRIRDLPMVGMGGLGGS